MYKFINKIHSGIVDLKTNALIILYIMLERFDDFQMKRGKKIKDKWYDN